MLCTPAKGLTVRRTSEDRNGWRLEDSQGPPTGNSLPQVCDHGKASSTAGSQREAKASTAERQRHTHPMSANLADLPNLGPKSQQMLSQAGITTVAQLRKIGSVAAYVRTKRSGAKVSLNLLWALEGAITGLPWQTVAREHRTSLRLHLRTINVTPKPVTPTDCHRWRPSWPRFRSNIEPLARDSLIAAP